MLSAEVVAFADLFDDAYALRSQVEQSLKCAVPMHLLTDSKSLFDIISKGSRSSEKRIMLDIRAAREAYQAREISNIGFVRSSDNLGDCLTKKNMQKALLQLLKNAKHEVKFEQWIIRLITCRLVLRLSVGNQTFCHYNNHKKGKIRKSKSNSKRE